MAQDKDRDFGLSPEIERLSAQLARDPNSKLFIPLAEEYMKADMAVEAVMTLEEGLKVHPAYMSARVLLGKAHLMAGDMDKACEQFENVIKAVPDNLYALKKLGEIYLAQGKRDESLKNFRILALLSPKDEELSDIISRLEAGELPPSPLSVPSPTKETPPAGEATPEVRTPESASKDTVKETASVEDAAQEPAHTEEADDEIGQVDEEAPEGAAPVYEIEAESEPASMETADTDIGQTGEEVPEGAAPVYEIGEEEIAELGLESVPEPVGQDIEGPTALDEAFDIPEPASAEPSPFDLGEEVPYQSGDSEALDLETVVPGEGAPSPDFGSADEEAAFRPGPADELQDIFASYGDEKGREDTSGSEAAVYELDEPADIDLEELGVKTTMSMTTAEEEAGQGQDADMPFDMDVESGEQTSSDNIFDLSDMGLDESPFEEASAEAGGGEDLPFDIMESEGQGLDEIPFDTAGMHGVETEKETVFESGGEPFGAESGLDLETGEEAFESGDVFGELGAEPEPPESSLTQPHEPIKTETLAEMYIKQGFYDRAINIYKELLRESPADMNLRQKLEELYMLAGMSSERSVSDSEAGSSMEPPPVDPADFVMEAGTEAEHSEEIEAARAEEQPAAQLAGEGKEVIGRLEEFLENIKRKGSQ